MAKGLKFADLAIGERFTFPKGKYPKLVQTKISDERYRCESRFEPSGTVDVPVSSTQVAVKRVGVTELPELAEDVVAEEVRKLVDRFGWGEVLVGVADMLASDGYLLVADMLEAASEKFPRQ